MQYRYDCNIFPRRIPLFNPYARQKYFQLYIAGTGRGIWKSKELSLICLCAHSSVLNIYIKTIKVLQQRSLLIVSFFVRTTTNMRTYVEMHVKRAFICIWMRIHAQTKIRSVASTRRKAITMREKNNFISINGRLKLLK